MTYLDFVIGKEHLFLRHLFDKDLLNEFDRAKNLTTYHENFIKITNCVRLLCEYYSMDSDIEDINHDCLEHFLRVDLNDEFISFEEVYEAINKQEKISFVNFNIMKIPNNHQIDGLPISSNFLTNIKNILFNAKVNLHHSHITGEIIGYAHVFCKRESKRK